MGRGYIIQPDAYLSRHADSIVRAAIILGVDPLAVGGALGDEVLEVRGNVLQSALDGIIALLPGSALQVPFVGDFDVGMGNIEIKTAV